MSRPVTRRALLQGAGAALLAPVPAVAAEDGPEREAMTRAALALLDALDARQRPRAAFPFNHDERRNWHYVPRRRAGIALKAMSAGARAAAHALLQAGLSPAGYAKIQDVIRLEEVLRRSELLGAMMRDPDNYAFTIFGSPGPAAAWGWRVEGHHLSFNFALVPGRPVTVTPAFLGANPARVPSDPHEGLRALRDEQDLGLALARSVPAALRARLVIAPDSPGDIVSGPGREASLRTPAGVALGELGADQRALAGRLLEVYVGNARAEVAAAQLARIRSAGLEQVHFAWAGPIDPSRPHYYRLHGPTVLIEYDNTQNDANHIHSVWRDPQRDFGGDPLGAHYAHGHVG